MSVNHLRAIGWMLVGLFGAYLAIIQGFVHRDIVLPKNGGRHISGPWAVLVGLLLLGGAVCFVVRGVRVWQGQSEDD